MTIDHVGLVVDDIEKARLEYFAFGMVVASPRYVDLAQGVTIQFLKDANGRRIELLQPTDSYSPVWRTLHERGTSKLAHICYHVGEQFEAALKSPDVRVVRPPTPAVAFNGRRVAFVLTRSMQLVEFLE